MNTEENKTKSYLLQTYRFVKVGNDLFEGFIPAYAAPDIETFR